ncbi:MAG: reverse transcriptase domain-containing protein [Bacteroidota bacterium]
MDSKKKKDWFKLKKYSHIGMPLKENERNKWIEDYIKNPDRIEKHSFLPFIHKTSKVRKFRKNYSTEDGNKIIKVSIDGSKKERSSDTKKRELFYAGHIDSLIFSYYSEILSEKYEQKLKEYFLSDVVLAYRSIPVNKNKPNGTKKCSIDFANDTFKYISEFKANDFIAIAFDIKGFFDNLSHENLRDVWVKLLGDQLKLHPDHFNIYKSITRYTYVDLIDLFNEFQNKIFVRTRGKNGKYNPIRRKKISKIKYLRKEGAIAFCTKKEFLKVKNKLLKNSKTAINENGNLVYKNFGIPQGSPISSILANLYMLNFDKTINDYIKLKGGIYRRYSDDMVVVCPKAEKDNIIKLMSKEITSKDINLEIQDKKTQIFHFKRTDEGLICGQEFENIINWNKNFMYLGFEFDGEIVLLKSASLSNYYRKMKRTIRRAKHFSENPENANHNEIFKRRILKKYSYKGAKRRRKWVKNKNGLGFIKSDFYNWGNFLSYAYKAENIMMKNKIKIQTRRHWNKLNDLLKN